MQLSALSATLGLGCLNLANESIVSLFLAHHGEPVDGVLPDYGGVDQPRSFTNDLNQPITVYDGYVVATSAILWNCDRFGDYIEFRWSPVAHDLLQSDGQTQVIADQPFDANEYCWLELGFGPYFSPPPESMVADPSPPPEEVEGNTLFIEGRTRNNGMNIDFVLRSPTSKNVVLDLTHIQNGGPLIIGRDEEFGVKLTVSVVYDRLFKNVDVVNMDPTVVGDQLVQGLEDALAVSLGDKIVTRQAL